MDVILPPGDGIALGVEFAAREGERKRVLFFFYFYRAW